MMPPTAAPPTVPAALPPVRTEPPTAPTPAPIAVLLSCADIPEQPPKPNSTVNAAAFTANLFIVFILNTSVLNIRCQGNYAVPRQLFSLSGAQIIGKWLFASG